jgi:hypothetical protein
MTSPVSGPSIVWNMFGNTAPADMVTAIAAPFNSKAAIATTTGGTGAATTGSTKKGQGQTLKGMRKDQIYALGGLVSLITLLY